MLRHRGLAALLLAEVVSTTGTQMTWLALPWFVLTTTGSASRMSLVAAAEVAAFAVFGIPAGSFVARLGARRSMLIADGVRAPVMMLVPVLHWLNALTYAGLVGLAFAMGLLATPYGAAQRVVVPEMLGEDEVAVSKANALLQSANRATTLLGPPIAGLLIGLIGATGVLVVDAATFLVSFALVGLFVEAAARRAAGADTDAGGVLAGVRYVLHDRLLRWWAGAITLGDAAWQVVFVGTPVLVFAHYGGDALLAGLILGAFGCGAILGNMVSYRAFEGRVPPRRIALALMVQAVPVAMLAVPAPGALLVAALAVSGFGNGVANPTIHATLTLRPPAPVRAKVFAAINVSSVIGGPLALLVAAPSFSAFGSRSVMGAAAAAQIAAMLVLGASMLWWDRQLVGRPERDAAAAVQAPSGGSHLPDPDPG
jgi:MFS family permease